MESRSWHCNLSCSVRKRIEGTSTYLRAHLVHLYSTIACSNSETCRCISIEEEAGCLRCMASSWKDQTPDHLHLLEMVQSNKQIWVKKSFSNSSTRATRWRLHRHPKTPTADFEFLILGLDAHCDCSWFKDLIGGRDSDRVESKHQQHVK